MIDCGGGNGYRTPKTNSLDCYVYNFSCWIFHGKINKMIMANGDCPYCDKDITDELEEEYFTDQYVDNFEFICECGGLIEIDVVFEDPTFYLRPVKKEVKQDD